MGKLDQAPQLLGFGVLPATNNQVAEARKITHEAVTEHPSCDIAVLLVSELMTNSVVHSGSHFVTLVITTTIDGDLHVSVIDEGRGGLPHLLPGGPHDEHGRGIELVDRLAKRWGITRERPPGMTVWFELDKCPPEAWLNVLMTDDDL
jgi:anti-sigma regulatory factor (Ser/Thr protein kinase)